MKSKISENADGDSRQIERIVMWKLNRVLAILYYLVGTIFTAMIVFICGVITFALTALFIYVTLIFFFSLQLGKEFQDFLNETIVYFFNNNKQLFAWIALAVAIPLFRHFNKKGES